VFSSSSQEFWELLFIHLYAGTFQVFFNVTASQNTTLVACLYFLLALNHMKTSIQESDSKQPNGQYFLDRKETNTSICGNYIIQTGLFNQNLHNDSHSAQLLLSRNPDKPTNQKFFPAYSRFIYISVLK